MAFGKEPSQPDTYQLSPADDRFLDDLEHRSFLYFWEQVGSKTGIVRDRAFVDGSSNGPNLHIGSAAATGFGLTAICIGAQRGWITEKEARDRILLTIRFLAERAPVEHGWFYHWMDPETGERRWNSEASSIDTALLLAGVLTAAERFTDDPEIGFFARYVYERVDFPWMLNGEKYLLAHGWVPESGFLRYRWNSYSELMILYILGIGSPTHPIPPESWYAWKRPSVTYQGMTYITGGPLFVHQYSQAWFDFRALRESGPDPVNWFDNSVLATRAQRAFCMDLATKFPSYSGDIWGITASDSSMGYQVWGEVPLSAHIDGTVAPSAPGGSLMFAPEIAMPSLRSMYDQFGKQIYNRYGFVDAFDPHSGWVGRDVIGINAGIILLSAEDLRSGFVWTLFMRSAAATTALQRLELIPQPSRKKPGFLRRLFSNLSPRPSKLARK